MRIDVQSLRLFVSVCEHKNIARAAEVEHIATSAASKRMASLEESLRVQLFLRTNKGIELTPAADSLLRHANVVLEDLLRLESEMFGHARGERGRVRLHASVSPIVQYLPRDIRGFLDAHPAVRIDLEEGLSQDVVRAVSENVADIGIFGGHASYAGLKVLPYRTDRLVVVMPEDHPLRGSDGLRFSEVAEHDLVGPQEGSYLNSLVLRAAADLERPLRLRIRVNGFEPACSMVEGKLGVALVPEFHARRYVAAGGLAAVPLDEDWALRRWNVCVREAEALATPVKLLLDHLAKRDEVTEVRGAGQP